MVKETSSRRRRRKKLSTSGRRESTTIKNKVPEDIVRARGRTTQEGIFTRVGHNYSRSLTGATRTTPKRTPEETNNKLASPCAVYPSVRVPWRSTTDLNLDP